MTSVFHRIWAVGLLGLVLWHAMLYTVVTVDFQVRRDFIAQYLCENRDKPELECNGQCHLEKSLEKARETSQEASSDKNSESLNMGSISVYYPSHFVYVPLCQSVVALLAQPRFHELADKAAQGYVPSCWQPPRGVFFTQLLLVS